MELLVPALARTLNLSTTMTDPSEDTVRTNVLLLTENSMFPPGLRVIATPPTCLAADACLPRGVF